MMLSTKGHDQRLHATQPYLTSDTLRPLVASGVLAETTCGRGTSHGYSIRVNAIAGSMTL